MAMKEIVKKNQGQNNCEKRNCPSNCCLLELDVTLLKRKLHQKRNGKTIVRKRICWSRSLQKQAIKVKKTRSFCCMLPTKKKGYISTSPRVKRLLAFFFTFPQRWLCPSFCFALLCFLTKCLLYCCKLLYFREKKKLLLSLPKRRASFFSRVLPTVSPQCCFLAQSFLFQVRGHHFCLKTLMLSLLFFLKETSLGVQNQTQKKQMNK